VFRIKLIVILILIVSFVSCRKEKTSWNSDWMAPLVHDTLSLNNLVNDSTLTINSSSFLEIDLTRTIIDLGIDDIIGIPDTIISHDYSISSGSLNVPPGFSIVNDVQEHTLVVEDIQLKRIRVSDGRIKVKVYNPLGTKVFFIVQLPGVVKNGVEFEQNYSVTGGSISNPGFAEATLDISGYEIDLTGENGSLFNLLQSRLIINSDPAGPTVNVTTAHQFKVDAEFIDVKIDYARGYFGNKIITDTISTEAFLDDNLLSNITAGAIDFPDCSLQFDITNGMKVDVKALITTVKNTNYAGNTISLNASAISSPIFLDPATGSWSSLTPSSESLVFNSTNSNIESYLENIGDIHTIGYNLQLNPWGNTSGGWNEIFPNSRLKVKLKAQMPMTIGVDGLTLQDTFNLDLSQDLEKSHVASGSFVIQATNAFPFSCNTVLYLMDTNNNVLHTVFGTDNVQSALYGVIDPSDGLKKMSSEVEFLLSSNIIKDLDKIKKVSVRAEFNTPDPETSSNLPVSVPAGAFLAIKLKARLNVEVIY
jgi:hypothetical protein